MPGFNADKRAEKREGSDVTAGEKKFRARRKTNSIMRAFRRKSRADDELERQLAAKARELRMLDPEWVRLQQEFKADQITDLGADAPGSLRERIAAEFEDFATKSDELAKLDAGELRTKRSALEDEISEIVDQRERLLYESIAVLLKDPAATADDEDAFDALVEHLLEHLATDEAQSMSAWLLGEDEADPTTPTTSAPAPA